MRKQILAIAAATVLGILSMLQFATAQELVSGEIKKVDAAAGKLTVKHGPMKKFDMDEPMTMVYGVKDPAMLKSVKVGEKIKFDADRVNGKMIITKIEKTK